MQHDSRSRYSRKRSNTRKRKILYIKLSMAGVVLATSLVVVLSLNKVKRNGDPVMADVTTEEPESDTQPVTEPPVLVKAIRVNQISITGLTKEAAAEKILEQYPWNITLAYGDENVSLNNPMASVIHDFLDDIYATPEAQRSPDYNLDVTAIEENIRGQVAEYAKKWNKKPIESQLTGRDKEKKQWIYSGGENGIEIDQDKTTLLIMNAVQAGDFQATIPVAADQTDPALSVEQTKANYKVIGEFSTTATSNQNRNNNISLAMNALDGLVIFPGEEFSFNKTTGNRTVERGYKPAGAYRNGEFVEEPGGGVCQVSSTLYNAIIFAGIATTERHPHSYEPSYVTPGEDAMVSYDGYSGPDLRFTNNQSTSVAIRAVFENQKLTISIVAMPVLEAGVKMEMRSEKTKEIDPPASTYEEDQTLQPDQEVEVTKGTKGSVWKTYLVKSRDGVVIEEKYFHSSTYRGKPGVIKRNTSGVVIPQETSGAASESSTAAETQPGIPPETQPETHPSQSTPVPDESTTPDQTAPTTSHTISPMESAPDGTNQGPGPVSGPGM